MTNLGTLNVLFQYKGIERPKTTAIIKNNNGEIIAKASVKKNRDDKANKIIGRFWAFKKAMNQTILEKTSTKQQRIEAWKNFSKLCKTPTFLNQ